MRGEPLAGREIPHPLRFSQSLPFTESDEWFACGTPVREVQGWKLYIPLTLLNAAELIERLVPILEKWCLHFKYIKDINLLRKLNAGMFGYTQIGKCFVIYVPEPHAAFITELKQTLTPYRDQCPVVPCALPFGFTRAFHDPLLEHFLDLLVFLSEKGFSDWLGQIEYLTRRNI